MKKIKRSLSLLLCLTMLIMLAPCAVQAADGEPSADAPSLFTAPPAPSGGGGGSVACQLSGSTLHLSELDDAAENVIVACYNEAGTLLRSAAGIVQNGSADLTVDTSCANVWTLFRLDGAYRPVAPAKTLPLAAATRVWVAEQLCAALNIDLNAYDPAKLDFTDCAGLTDAQKRTVLAVVNTHMMNGTDVRTFAPEQSLTREQAATILSRMALAANVSGVTLPYADVESDRWSADAVRFLYSIGALEDTDRFYPAGTMLQEDFSAWLERYTAVFPALPCVNVTTASGSPIMSKETYVDAHITITEAQGETVDKDITIKGRGNTSWDMPKKGYTFKFDKKQDVLGLGKSKKWALVANYSDKTLLRNVLASVLAGEVYNDSGMWQPEHVPVNVFLNGEYAGVYTLAETIKIDGKRVDIPDISDEQEEGFTLDQGGFILEIDNRLDEMYHFQSTHGVNFCLSDPDLDDGSKNDFTAEQIVDHVKTVVQTAEDALFSDSFADPDTGYAKYLDVDSFIEWYLVNELTRNADSIFHTSCFLYYDPADAKLHMGPIWDFDISCGNIDYNGCDNPEGLWTVAASWYARLFQDPAFTARVKQYWTAKRTQLDTVVNTEIGARADKLRVGAELNFKRWPILGTYVWPNADGYAKRTTYQSEVDYLVNWLNARIAWLDTQWAPSPS